MHYELIIYWSKADETFVVEVPELPGCMADGATYEEAIGNAQIVIAEWMEPPNPSFSPSRNPVANWLMPSKATPHFCSMSGQPRGGWRQTDHRSARRARLMDIAEGEASELIRFR